MYLIQQQFFYHENLFHDTIYIDKKFNQFTKDYYTGVLNNVLLLLSTQSFVLNDDFKCDVIDSCIKIFECELENSMFVNNCIFKTDNTNTEIAQNSETIDLYHTDYNDVIFCENAKFLHKYLCSLFYFKNKCVINNILREFNFYKESKRKKISCFGLFTEATALNYIKYNNTLDVTKNNNIFLLLFFDSFFLKKK